MSNTYALYNLESGLIENIILMDDDFAKIYPVQENQAVVKMPADLHGEWSPLGIGWSFINNEFVEPSAPERIATEPQPVVSGAQTL